MIARDYAALNRINLLAKLAGAHAELARLKRAGRAAQRRLAAVRDAGAEAEFLPDAPRIRATDACNWLCRHQDAAWLEVAALQAAYLLLYKGRGLAAGYDPARTRCGLPAKRTMEHVAYFLHVHRDEPEPKRPDESWADAGARRKREGDAATAAHAAAVAAALAGYEAALAAHNAQAGANEAAWAKLEGARQKANEARSERAATVDRAAARAKWEARGQVAAVWPKQRDLALLPR